IPLSARPVGFLPQTLLIAILMNYAAYSHFSWTLLLTLNLAFVTVAFLIYRLNVMTGNKRETELLYDELKLRHYDLEATRKTVVDYARRVQELTQVEERNRIAHDLHDDLGHKLIRLKMMLEATSRLGPENQDKVMEIVREVRDQLGEGMESLRSTVRRLKPASSVTGQY